MSEKPQESPSKTTTIAILRDTIQRLEGIVNKLDAETASQEIPAASFENLVASAEELAKSLESSKSSGISETEGWEIEEESTVSPVIPTTGQEDLEMIEEVADFGDSFSVDEDNIEPVKDSLKEDQTVTTPPLSWIDRILPSFGSLQRLWDWGMGKIRSLLPEMLNEKLSDVALTGILTGVVVTLMFSTVFLLPDRPWEMTEEIPEGTEIPLELTAPKEAQLLSEVPPPVPKLTPEQQLITVIQTQLAQVTDEFEKGLVTSVNANFLRSRLLVEMGGKWYNLPVSQQDQLANEIFIRSQQLDFSKLEMLDGEGMTVARSPVVGEDMLIFKRRNFTNAIDSVQ